MADGLVLQEGASWFGIAIGAVIAGFYAFKRLNNDNKISGVSTHAAVDMLKRMHDLLDLEKSNVAAQQVLLSEAHERIERINKERNDLVKEIGKMYGQLQSLEYEVKLLREKVDAQSS